MLTARNMMRREGQGMVLVLVLLIILVLSVILLEFSSATNLEVEISAASVRGAQALNCAEAGVSFAISALRLNPDALLDNPLKDNSLRKLLTGQAALPVGEGECKITVEPLSGRMNINALTTPDGRVDRSRVEQFLRLIDAMNAQEGMKDTQISYSLAASIMDWVDDDDDVTTLDWVMGENEGAENDYYLKEAMPPHLCKNAPFDTLDELLRVKGMAREFLDGRKGDEEKNIKPIEGMRKFLTVYGNAKVDINQASLFVLESLPQMNATLAQAIIDRRNELPFRTTDELRLMPGFPPAVFNALKNYITASPQSRYFSIISVGTLKLEDQTIAERRVSVVIRLQGLGKDAAILMRQEP